MQTSAQMADNKRRNDLQAILRRLRNETYEGIAKYRQDQSEEKESSPGDEMDVARASAAVDTHANLIDRAESRLRLIDEALARVDNGTYGICADCDDEIGLERLKILPFAVRCVDCESRRSRSEGATSRLGEGAGQWMRPADVNEADSEEREREAPDDLSVVSSESAFDVEPEELEEQPAPRTRGRRGRPRST
ncbi:MAG: TraR/DksA C4-type zinc finger protein [Deltaproteobacteria bacterium]|nr:TraR/DksA C4-type zinc finger protein [Deltaproteobacteria bacterium]